MNETYFKVKCRTCDVNIEFPFVMNGTDAKCPECQSYQRLEISQLDVIKHNQKVLSGNQHESTPTTTTDPITTLTVIDLKSINPTTAIFVSAFMVILTIIIVSICLNSASDNRVRNTEYKIELRPVYR